MAGLNCEIKWETRLCEVNGELGYFHCWEHWSNVIDASPLRGGHPGGQIGQVYGIVEFTDGVRRIDPAKIKFCDEENALLAEMAKHHQEGNAWHPCQYVDCKLEHDGSWVDGRWYEWEDIYGSREVARMKLDAIDHFYPCAKIIKEEDVCRYRELEEGEDNADY